MHFERESENRFKSDENFFVFITRVLYLYQKKNTSSLLSKKVYSHTMGFDETLNVNEFFTIFLSKEKDKVLNSNKYCNPLYQIKL